MTAVQKWGNSLVVRIPASAAEQMALSAGVPVDVTARNRALVIRPLRRARYRLKELLKDCRPEQLPGECDLGNSVGREVVE